MNKAWITFIVCFLAISLALMTSAGVVRAKTIKLTFIGPLTGPNAAQGTGMRNCFDLAIREANESGEFPYKIKIMDLDDASDPAVAFSASLKALSDKRVVAGSA